MMIAIRKYIDKKPMYLVGVKRGYAKSWNDGGRSVLRNQVMRVYPKDDGKEKGVIPTAVYVPDSAKAKQFDCMQNAEAYLIENSDVLKGCSIIMG